MASGQTISGYVFDALTNEPLESVAVYFDNTTIGTTTDSKGYFTLDYTAAIKSTLVYSYLGYTIQYDEDYRDKTEVQIRLKVNVNELDTVFIEYDDGLTRKQKLKLFRREFLGQSLSAKSCKILNEEDLILRYDKDKRLLSATATKPLVLWNNYLRYKVLYDLMEFQVSFKYANIADDYFNTDAVIYVGTSFFKDLNETYKKRSERRRNNVYLGSVQHFMRAIYNGNLIDENFGIYAQSFPVDSRDYILVSDTENPILKQVQLKDKISILYNKEAQSDLRLTADAFYIDPFGNHSPIQGVLFSGAMGDQRIGDILPLDYKPKN